MAFYYVSTPPPRVRPLSGLEAAREEMGSEAREGGSGKIRISIGI